MKKLITIIITAVLIVLTQSCVHGYTHKDFPGVEFYIPKNNTQYEFEGNLYDNRTWHKALIHAGVRAAWKYFNYIDPDFDIKDYQITIFVSNEMYRDSFGVYNWNHIFIKPYDHPYDLLGLEMDPIIYAALISHEIAHAILHQRHGGEYKDIAAHEYFAYNVTWDLLGRESLEEAIGKYINKGIVLKPFNNESKITRATLYDRPEQFAIRSRLYHLRDNGKLFKRIWDGNWKEGG